MTNDMHLIWTVSGKRIDPSDPDPALIDIEDIAYSLAGINRFGAHTRPRYTVAEHSVMVSRLVEDDVALRGLLHDAPEAYLGDIISPVKRCIDTQNVFVWMEDAIGERFLGGPSRIKTWPISQVDKDVMAAESHFLGHGEMPVIDQTVYEAALERLAANAKCASRAGTLTPEARFLARFRELRGE